MSCPPPVFPFQSLAFGRRWASQVALPLWTPDTGTACSPDFAKAEIRVSLQREPAAERTLRHPASDRQHTRFAADGFRYDAGDGLLLDAFAPSRLQVHTPGDWTGELPAALYSTVSALLLAWQGLIPLHGSAIEEDGQAVLICGQAGAGKSTVAARRVAAGARLLSDDLSILHPDPQGGVPHLYAGRRSIRLFPSTAAELDGRIAWQEPAFSMGSKLAVFPPQVPATQPIPLRKVILLGLPQGPVADADRANLLTAQLFRPMRLRAVPGHALRRAALALAARHLQVVGADALSGSPAGSLA